MLKVNNKGFTLIELLIVIVIIGILAGVLIAVIDPTTQQNRARDANVRSTINKIALATNGYISAYGRIPSDIEFQGGLAGFVEMAAGECSGAGADDEASCLFNMTNSPLTSTGCAANTYEGLAGGSQCYYFYCGGDATDDTTACAFDKVPPGVTRAYRIFAKAYGSENIFMYRSATSQLYLCDSGGENCNVY